MADEKATLIIDADAEKAIREMSRLQQAATRTADQLHAIKMRAAGTSTATADLTHKASGLADALGAVHKANNVVGGSFSSLTGPLDDFGDLLEKVGARNAALMAGLGGAAAALVALGANVVDVSANFREYEQQLGRMNPTIVENRDKLNAVGDALLYVSNRWSELRVSLAGQTVDAISATGDAIKSAAEATKGSWIPQVDALGQLLDLTYRYGKATSDAAAMEGAAAREKEMLVELDRKLAEGAKEYERKKAEEKRAAEEASRAAEESARRAAEAALRHAEAVRAETEAITAHTAALGADLAASMRAAQEADLARTLATVQTVQGGMEASSRTGFVDVGGVGEDIASLDAQVKQSGQTAQAWAQQWGGAIETVGGAAVDFTRTISSAAVAIIEATDGQTRKARRKQLTALKAAALIEASINTVLGVTKALGSASPPINFILAAATAAAGAVQIGLIAAKPVDVAHRGAILPDETASGSLVTRRNEVPAVVTAQGARAMGGEEGVKRALAGDTMPQAAPIYLVVDGQPRLARAFAGPDPNFGISRTVA